METPMATKKGAMGAVGCGVLAWIASVIAVATSQWLAVSWLVLGPNGQWLGQAELETSPTLLTGLEGTVYGVGGASYRLKIGSITNDACRSDLEMVGTVVNNRSAYDYFGALGFCDEEDGTFRVPGEQIAMLTVGALAVVLLALAIALTLLSASHSSRCLRRFAFGVFALSAGLEITQFALAVSGEYYSAIRDGRAGFLVPSGATEASENDYILLITEPTDPVRFGLGFWSAVLAALFALFAASSVLVPTRTAPALEEDFAAPPTLDRGAIPPPAKGADLEAGAAFPQNANAHVITQV